jgi:Tol biopolymer transport system component
MKRLRVVWWMLGLSTGWACTGPNPDFCGSHAECEETGYCNLTASVCAPRPDNGSWSEPTALTSLNTEGHERGPSLTADGLEIFWFARSETSGTGPYHIYSARRTDLSSPWSEPDYLVAANAALYFSINPEVSSDGLTLWYASDLEDTGNYSIWRLSRTSRSAGWGAGQRIDTLSAGSPHSVAVDHGGTYAVLAVAEESDEHLYFTSRATSSQDWDENLMPLRAIQSGLSDEEPELSESGLQIFFASESPSGGTRLDIVRATRNSDTSDFGSPTLVEGLNSSMDDSGPWLSPDGTYIVFASLRDGDWNLYESYLE